MKVRRWIGRMVILDLLAAGLLFLMRHDTPYIWQTISFQEDRSRAGAGRTEQKTEAGEAQKEESGQKAAGAAPGKGVAEEDNKAEEGKQIALTFDDGPDPRYTETLLDGLKERGVKVTFFVTGANVSKYPRIVKRMQEEGHLIGNHTYHHVQLTAANGEQFRDEIISTNEAIREVTGEDTEYIRPPYGSWNKKYEEELNMFPVLWSIDPRDWCTDDKDCIVRNTVGRIKEGDIILMHDQYPSSIAAALEIVDRLQKEGYVFVTVDEMLLD